MTGLLKVRTTKEFGESTVSKILDLVENSSMKKARTENFITRFARVYTPADKDGVNYVKQAYITKKYQDTAWIFDTAYKFFRQEAVKIIPKPQEAESPIWMYRDKKWAVPNAGCRRMRLEISKD